jgi:hypothetical protein
MCKSREFADYLFDRCIILLHHLLFLCKTEFTLQNIRLIYDNIEHIETTMRKEIYDKKLQNIIESEVRNNNTTNKNRINTYIENNSKNIDCNIEAKANLTNIHELINNTKKEFSVSIKDKDINDVIGDPKVILGLQKDDIQLDLIINRFDDSKFCKFWKDRIKSENEFIESCDNPKIGDILNIKKREKITKQMLNIIKTRHEKQKPGENINLDVDEQYTIENIINNQNNQIVHNDEEQDINSNDDYNNEDYNNEDYNNEDSHTNIQSVINV